MYGGSSQVMGSVGAGPMSMTVTGVHCALNVPVDDPTTVMVVSGGQAQLTVAGPLQSGRVIVVAGDSKGTVVGGHVTTVGGGAGQANTTVVGPVI